MTRHLLTGLLSLTPSLLSLNAAEPSLKSLFPAGSSRSSSTEITLDGKMENATVWIDTTGITFTPPDSKGKTTVTITDHAPLGTHLLRLVNDQGVSDIKRFVIGNQPETTKTGPIPAWQSAQTLPTLPITVNGRIDKAGETDHYAIQLKKGQRLHLQLQSYELGSPIDPLIHILDHRGYRLLTLSDSANLDPAGIFEAPATALYHIQIGGFIHPPAATVDFTGGSSVIYRLNLRDAATLKEHSPPIHPPAPHHPDLKPSHTDPRIAWLHSPTHPRAQGLLLSTLTPTRDAPIPVPGLSTGTLTAKPAQNTHLFTAKKGQNLRLEVFCQRLGHTLDTTLQILNPNGSQLASNEDFSGNPDPLITWKAPEDGSYQAIVADQFHRGTPGATYLLHISEVQPSFTATLASGKPLRIARGRETDCKLTVKLLDGWKAPLQVRAIDLPPGITAKPIPIPEKGGEITLKLQATKDAPLSTHPFHLLIEPKPTPQPPPTENPDSPPKETKPTPTNTLTNTLIPHYDLRSETRRGITSTDAHHLLWITTTEK